MFVTILQENRVFVCAAGNSFKQDKKSKGLHFTASVASDGDSNACKPGAE